jgi:hypothetical protein
MAGSKVLFFLSNSHGVISTFKDTAAKFMLEFRVDGKTSCILQCFLKANTTINKSLS